MQDGSRVDRCGSSSTPGKDNALLDHDAPWCFGAWHPVSVAHPRWGSTVPFYLDIEASGRPEFPLLVIAPRELRRFASRWCRRAEQGEPLTHRLAIRRSRHRHPPVAVPAARRPRDEHLQLAHAVRRAPTTTPPTTRPTGSTTGTWPGSPGFTPRSSSTLTAIPARCWTSPPGRRAREGGRGAYLAQPASMPPPPATHGLRRGEDSRASPAPGEADDGSRTRDLRLGKPTLYQLSYVRWSQTFACLEARDYPKVNTYA